MFFWVHQRPLQPLIPMVLLPIPAFSDNYIWLLHDGRRAVVVDPGQASPVWEVLQDQGLTLERILVTHHHADHIGGVAELQAATGASVVAPKHECAPLSAELRVGQGSGFQALGLAWQVLDVPGHTAGHVAYVTQAHLATSANTAATEVPLLFCGDTLFSGGCGRLFEGTPAQMLASLDQLAALPAATLVCCAHEYTLANLRFARAADPMNTELQAWETQCLLLREQQRPTLPTTLGRERAINPFLRSREPALRLAAQTQNPLALDDAAVFAALRQWKNHF